MWTTYSLAHLLKPVLAVALLALVGGLRVVQGVPLRHPLQRWFIAVAAGLFVLEWINV